MAKNDAISKSGLALKLYIAAGIVIFISIAYTVANKPARVPQSETTAAPAPVQPDAPSKEKTDLDATKVAETNAAQNPTAGNYLSLAFVYYNTKRYPECIEMNRKALALNPNLGTAYNNICSAYNSMGKWDSAIMACNMALKVQPDLTLAKNNLAWAEQMLTKGK